MMLIYLWLGYLLLVLFLLGSAVGSFLNVCVARLPRGMSLAWPGSHCFACGRRIPLRENIPLVSYCLLGGRCRGCGATYSSRYFWVELLTGAAFVTIFLLEAGLNIHRYPFLGDVGLAHLQWARFPPAIWRLTFFHALFFCLLLVAAACSLEYRRVPGSVVALGLLAGLLFAGLYPWPAPTPPAEALSPPGLSHFPLGVDRPPLPGKPRGPMPDASSWAAAAFSPRAGFQPWPFWGPLPLEAGGLALGLTTAVLGFVAGLLLVLAAPVRSSWGDAWVLALGGVFLGWQPALLAFGAALALAVPLSLLLPRSPERPPWLIRLLPPALLAAWLGWPWLGGLLSAWLFRPDAVLAGGAVVLLLLAGRVLLAPGLLDRPREPLPSRIQEPLREESVVPGGEAPAMSGEEGGVAGVLPPQLPSGLPGGPRDGPGEVPPGEDA